MKRKRPDKFDWIFVAFVLIMSAIVFVLTGCQTQEPEFSVLGKWQGTNWYCNQCQGANQIDQASTIDFEILTMDSKGGLAITQGKRYNPSCQKNCTSLPWHVVSATFVNNSLRIEWFTGHVFTGKLQGNVFVGQIDYISDISYLFNDEIKIVRKQ